MDELGILPKFQGVMCHGQWKPYYKYGTTHALCNANHLREVKRAREQDGQKWAEQMSILLKEINKATPVKQGAAWKLRSRNITGNATETCCTKPRKSAQHPMKQTEKAVEERSSVQNHKIF